MMIRMMFFVIHSQNIDHDDAQTSSNYYNKIPNDASYSFITHYLGQNAALLVSLMPSILKIAWHSIVKWIC